MSQPAPFDPERIIRALADQEVAYVLIGALGARLYGFPRLTADMDITPDRAAENLDRLALALRQLNARVYTESVPEGLRFDCSAKALARADMWNLVTDAGRLDVAFLPAGTEGFEDLSRSSVAFETFGETIQVASLADLIRTKTAADRPQDRQDVPVLLALLSRQR